MQDSDWIILMDESALERILHERLQTVEERLTAACRRSGRSRQDVTLVAVTKTISAQMAALLPDWGLVDLGESRPQELVHKVEHWRTVHPLRVDVRWHMIGHLQRNKIDKVLPLAHLIHSVDSIRLLQALDKEAVRQDLNPAVLLEVNTSGEDNKHGFDPAQVRDLAPVVLGLERVEVRGLMTMAALQEPEACRPSFARLRGLRDELREILGPRHSLEHLSMGMTNDFDVAVEEGATLVRLGSILFDGLEHEPQ
jgi:pyridoxal phosphate enzyme (YggS family)